MLRILAIVILITFASFIQADKFDACSDVIIDDVTEMAFGQHGIIYTGEVICYRDSDKQILKSKRTFENGKPIGRHICYDEYGTPDDSISYNHTKIKKHGKNQTRLCNLHRKKAALGYCEQFNPGPSWDDEPCEDNNDECIFICK